MSDLDVAKKRLAEALKDSASKYWELMKNWCRRKIAKEEFDTKARSLLGDGNIQLHNEFLFAILVKCQLGIHSDSRMTWGSSHLPRSTSRSKETSLDAFPTTVPYGAMNTFQYHTPLSAQLPGRDLDTILLCSHEMLLPDPSTLHARMLLGAWECGLEGVSEEAAHFLLLALQCHLKNVITTCIAHCNTWRLREGCFRYAFGKGVVSRAQEGRSHSVTEAELLAQSTQNYSDPITLFDVRDALLMNRSSLPVHTVYACTMERILGGMWHPSREEEEQQKAVNEWRKTAEVPPPFSLRPNR